MVMYAINAGNNIFEAIGFEYPGEEVLKTMSNEDKKAVYLEGIIKINDALKLLSSFQYEPRITIIVWNLHLFKNRFTLLLNELGLSNEEIDLKIKSETDKKKVNQK